MDSALQASLSSWRSRLADAPPTIDIQPLSAYLKGLAADALRRVIGLHVRPEDAQLELYALRLWETIDLQDQRRNMNVSGMPELRSFVCDLENGRLYYGQVDANVLNDVVVAQGLELGENRAADEFERCYMPHARAQADQFAGPRGF